MSRDMACSPVGDRCTYEASSGPVDFNGLRNFAVSPCVRSRKLLSDSGQDSPSGRTRLRRDWPSGQKRLRRGCLVRFLWSLTSGDVGELPHITNRGWGAPAPVSLYTRPKTFDGGICSSIFRKELGGSSSS